jgi:hypothetical protein
MTAAATAIVGPSDPAELSPPQWQARHAALRSRGAADDDPRVLECLAALSYWRCKRTLDREAEVGRLTREHAALLVARLRGAVS